MQYIISLYRFGKLAYVGYADYAMKRLKVHNNFRGDMQVIARAFVNGRLVCGYEVRIKEA